MLNEDLDEPDISTALVKVGSKGVPQNMCRHPLFEAGMLPSFAANRLQRGDAQPDRPDCAPETANGAVWSDTRILGC